MRHLRCAPIRKGSAQLSEPAFYIKRQKTTSAMDGRGHVVERHLALTTQRDHYLGERQKQSN
jgi:hypothetical protein